MPGIWKSNNAQDGTDLRAEILGSIIKVQLSGNKSRGTVTRFNSPLSCIFGICLRMCMKFLRPQLRVRLFNTAAHFNIKHNVSPRYWFESSSMRQKGGMFTLEVMISSDCARITARTKPEKWRAFVQHLNLLRQSPSDGASISMNFLSQSFPE